MRAMWKGTISFGLVNIPVQMYSAVEPREISFSLLHKKDLSPIRYAKICKLEEKEIPYHELAKAYEYEPGQYVLMDDDDFKKADLQASKSIEIVSFVDLEEIDTIYYSKPYFLEPDKNSSVAYSLLREALMQSKKAGLARYNLRNHQHLAVVSVYQGILILNELRYYSEVRVYEDLKIPPKAKFSSKELAIAIQLIEQQVEPFDAKQYTDHYAEELKGIIRRKAKGQQGVKVAKAKETKPTKVHDIMALLKASLEAPAKAAPKKKSSAAPIPKKRKAG